MLERGMNCSRVIYGRSGSDEISTGLDLDLQAELITERVDCEMVTTRL